MKIFIEKFLKNVFSTKTLSVLYSNKVDSVYNVKTIFEYGGFLTIQDVKVNENDIINFYHEYKEKHRLKLKQ